MIEGRTKKGTPLYAAKMGIEFSRTIDYNRRKRNPVYRLTVPYHDFKQRASTSGGKESDMKRTYESSYTPEQVMNAINILVGVSQKDNVFLERRTRRNYSVSSNFAKDNKTRLFLTGGSTRHPQKISCTISVTEKENGSVIEVAARLFLWRDIIFYGVFLCLWVYSVILLQKMLFLYFSLVIIAAASLIGYIDRYRMLNLFFTDVIYQVDLGSKQMQ